MNQHDDKDSFSEFSEEELEIMFKEAEEEEPAPRPLIGSPRFRRGMGIVIALMLATQVFAFWPKIYSLAAIEFLTTSAQLSQSEDIQRYKQSIVEVRTSEAKGTGFLISEDGLIVTNRHVIGGDEDIRPVVSIPGKSSYVSEVVAIHPNADLALLKVEIFDAPVLPLAMRYDGTAEIPIYVIGNPLFFHGIANEGVTWGLLSDDLVSSMVLQAPIYKGNSGSPVITTDGQVIGVVFATTTVYRNNKEHKVGLAVPVNHVHELLMDSREE